MELTSDIMYTLLDKVRTIEQLRNTIQKYYDSRKFEITIMHEINTKKSARGISVLTLRLVYAIGKKIVDFSIPVEIWRISVAGTVVQCVIIKWVDFVSKF